MWESLLLQRLKQVTTGGNVIKTLPYKCPVCKHMISKTPFTIELIQSTCDRCGNSFEPESNFLIVRYVDDTKEENPCHIFEVLVSFPQCMKCGSYIGAIRHRCTSTEPTEVTQEFERMIKK